MFILFKIIIPILLQHLITATPIINTNNSTIRLAIFDWATYEGTNHLWGDPESRLLMSIFFMVEKIFNTRNDTILPILSTIKSTCNKKIEIVRYCDISSSPYRAGNDVKWVIENFNIHGIVGFSGGETSYVGSIVASTYEIPTIDYYASNSRLSDKSNFPLFARTIISDDVNARMIAQFIHQFIVNSKNKISISLFYFIDGKEFATFLENELSLLHDDNLNILSWIEFKYGVLDHNIDEKVKLLANNQHDASPQIIVCATWFGQAFDIANAADKYHLLDSTKFIWIWTYISAVPIPEYYEANPNLERLMHGSFWIRYSTSNENMNHLVSDDNIWSSIISVQEINSRVPPFGNKNKIDSCKDSELDIQLSPNDFFTKYLGNKYLTDAWSRAADAILTFGMAVCLNNTHTSIPTGYHLYEAIRNVSFVGFSGNKVEFDHNGDRAANTAGWVIMNWDHQNAFVVGNYNVALNRFDIDHNQIVFRNGKGWENNPVYYSSGMNVKQNIILWLVVIYYGVLMVL
jgi:hypothetical protein